ncbi:MAG: hypothetical protein ACOYUZ_05620 [Patescibacteria group bacterium]
MALTDDKVRLLIASVGEAMQNQWRVVILGLPDEQIAVIERMIAKSAKGTAKTNAQSAKDCKALRQRRIIIFIEPETDSDS